MALIICIVRIVSVANGVVNVHRDALLVCPLKANYKCVGCSVMATGLLAANYMYWKHT